MSMRYAVASRISIQVRLQRGKTGLMWACENKHMEICLFLLDNGSDVDIRDKVSLIGESLTNVGKTNCSPCRRWYWIFANLFTFD
jgi:hypothetical protein